MEEAKSKYIIAKFADNWADEMNIEGVDVMLREDFFTLYDIIKEINEPIEISIGSNEEMYYSNGPALLKKIKIKDIDEEFATKFNEEIGSIGFSPFDIIYGYLEWQGLIPEDYEDGLSDDDDDDSVDGFDIDYTR